MKHLIILSTLLFTTACGLFDGRVVWPSVVSCGAEPAQDLVIAVTAILSGETNPKKELTALAKKHGAEMIVCIVRSLVAQSEGVALSPEMDPPPLDPGATERAQEFLTSIGH